LIPVVIQSVLHRKPVPVYGDGMNVRDWLYVRDHCSGIRVVLAKGCIGETYNIGGWNEMPNKQIVQTVCALLDELRPDAKGPHERLITYVTDRPGHDRRYAIDASKIRSEIGWAPRFTFETALPLTIRWYRAETEWLQRVRTGAYREYYARQYGGSSAPA
jgi:dTDP-glucose 4,6-dehydratase